MAVSDPSFLDIFTLHLASRLLGDEEILSRLENGTHRQEMNLNGGQEQLLAHGSFRLYWRTPPLVNLDPMSMLPSFWTSSSVGSRECRQDDDQFKPFFLDITFDFSTSDQTDGNDPHPSVATRFGALLASPDARDGFYVRGPPFTLEELIKHAEEVSIDVDSMNPKESLLPLAHTMAKAFLGFSTHQQSTTMVKTRVLLDAKSKISIPLFYEDFHETGNLTFNAVEMSKPDTCVMEMLFSTMQKEQTAGDSSDRNATHNDEDLTQAFQRWQQASSVTKNKGVVNDSLSSNGVERLAASTSKCSEATTDNSNPSQSKQESIETNFFGNRKREDSKLAGVVVSRVSASKRRKRGKVTYSKTGS